LEAQSANMTNTDNTSRNIRPRETLVARKCTYEEFMSCQPFYFNGTKGVVGLIHWFERTGSVFSHRKCTEDCKMKFATGVRNDFPMTLQLQLENIYIAADRALTGLLCKSFQHGQVVIVSGTYFSAVPIRSKFSGVILQSLSSLSIDQREIFSLYLFPGNDLS
nr:reverse transcriptase domain-containing protein [Tanacetum cinerariifolium]